MNSVEVTNAISRANSRAKVITSLDAAYGSKNDSQGAKTDSRIQSVVSGPVSSKKVQLVVESLVGRQEGPSSLSSVRDFNSLTLSLENKALVLDNSKRQTDASKSIARIKRIQRRSKVASRSWLGSMKLCDPMGLSALEDLVSVHALWRSYLRSVISDKGKNIVSGLQFQARFDVASKLGAKVTVVQSKAVHQVGLLGILTSMNSVNYYVTSVHWQKKKVVAGTSSLASIETKSETSAVGDTSTARKSIDDAHSVIVDDEIWSVSITVSRIEINNCVLGVYIPTQKQQHDVKLQGHKQRQELQLSIVADSGASESSRDKGYPVRNDKSTSASSTGMKRPFDTIMNEDTPDHLLMQDLINVHSYNSNNSNQHQIQPNQHQQQREIRPSNPHNNEKLTKLIEFVDNLHSIQAIHYNRMCLLYGKQYDKYSIVNKGTNRKRK